METEVPGERVLGGEDPLTVWTVELRHPLVDGVYVGLTKKIIRISLKKIHKSLLLRSSFSSCSLNLDVHHMHAFFKGRRSNSTIIYSSLSTIISYENDSKSDQLSIS